jgi:hypothetical protein
VKRVLLVDSRPDRPYLGIASEDAQKVSLLSIAHIAVYMKRHMGVRHFRLADILKPPQSQVCVLHRNPLSSSPLPVPACAVLVDHRQFVGETLPLVDLRKPLLFHLEDCHCFHGSPACNVPLAAFSEDSVQQARGTEKTAVSGMEWSDRAPACHFSLGRRKGSACFHAPEPGSRSSM